MSSPILDSAVLIDCLRAHWPAVSFVAGLKRTGPLVTHVSAIAELLTGARDKREQAVIESFLLPFQVLSPTEADGLAALDLYRKYRLSHGVDWPDCQIASTATRLSAKVYTQNLKHFAAFPGLEAVRAY